MEDLATGLAGGTLIFRGSKIPIPQKTGMKPGGCSPFFMWRSTEEHLILSMIVLQSGEDDQKLFVMLFQEKGPQMLMSVI
jgi:hypothetical protein